MATLTPNYNLSKPESTDDYRDFLDSYGDNMDIIDQNMGGGGHTIVDPTGTDMPQENKLQFTGAVNVSDDSVNGRTVVDVEGGGNYYLNTLYSTDEKKIGYWTDGKPLYGKVVKSTTAPSANAWNEVALPANISVKIYDAYYVRTTGAIDKFSVYRGDSNPSEMLVCSISNSTVYYRISSQFVANFSEFVIIICYTKTTDTPELNPQTGGVIYLPSIYSTEEREIGVYTDGKPLYQKTWTGLNVTPSYNSWSNVIPNDVNIETLVKWQALSNGNYKNLDGTGIEWEVTSSYVRAEYNQNANVRTIEILTLQYTKTTDVAGSGDWTPSGARAVHYSTNEQVIGTYLGKPLYKRSMALASSVTIGTAWTSLGLVFSSDIETIVDGKLIRNGKQLFACSFDYDDSTKVARAMTFLNNLSLNTDTIVTLQYTKTTD